MAAQVSNGGRPMHAANRQRAVGSRARPLTPRRAPCVVHTAMRVLVVEQPANLPRAREGRVAVVDLAFAGGDNFEKITVPFLDALGGRLAIWIDHHEHPVGWARVRGDPRFVLVPNRDAHACPELVTPEVVRRAGAGGGVGAPARPGGLPPAAGGPAPGAPPPAAGPRGPPPRGHRPVARRGGVGGAQRPPLRAGERRRPRHHRPARAPDARRALEYGREAAGRLLHRKEAMSLPLPNPSAGPVPLAGGRGTVP